MEPGVETSKTRAIANSLRGEAGRGYTAAEVVLVTDTTGDVSEARAIIREHRESSGERLSFTAFIINCLGKAVESNPHTHAYRDWRNRLVIFKDVNINSMVEVEMNGRKVPMPHIFKAVNKRSFRDIHEEMRSTQKRPGKTTEANFMRWFLIFPAFIRRLFYRIVLRFPHSLRNYSSPITVTAVGMFGRGGSAWGIPMALFLFLRYRMIAALGAVPPVEYLANPLWHTDTTTRLVNATMLWGFGLLTSVLPMPCLSPSGTGSEGARAFLRLYTQRGAPLSGPKESGSSVPQTRLALRMGIA